ncbi:hypothetical protein L1887_28330 [Cichorium endivia]|nr:hypothetical protein L1887_28330 [Cichorium endivia]
MLLNCPEAKYRRHQLSPKRQDYRRFKRSIVPSITPYPSAKRHIRDRFTKVVNSYKPWLLREPQMLWVLVMLHLIQLCLNPGKV